VGVHTISIHGDEHLKTGSLGSVEEAAILQTQPGESGCLTVVIRKQQAKALVDAFMRVESQSAGHGRKSVKEFVQRIAAFKIVEQGLGRHAGAAKNGYTTHDIRVPDDHASHIAIVVHTVPARNSCRPMR